MAELIAKIFNFSLFLPHSEAVLLRRQVVGGSASGGNFLGAS